MATKITLRMAEFALLHYDQPNLNDHTSERSDLHLHDALDLKFDMPTDGNEFKKVYTEAGGGVGVPGISVVVMLPADGSAGNGTTEKALSFARLANAFDAETITYATKQNDTEIIGYADVNDSRLYINGNIVTGIDSPELLKCLKTGIEVICEKAGTQQGYRITTNENSRPWMEFYVDESTTCGLVVTPLSPLSGVAPAQADNTFAWEITDPGECLAELKPTAVTFGWRNTDGSKMQQIPLSADARSVTIPAGTFAGNAEIEWWVTVTANSGEVTISDGVTLSTADAISKAVAISPIDTVVDSTKETTFHWRHIISTGTAQTGAYLVFGETEDVAFGNLLFSATVEGDRQQWTCQPGFLTSKVKYWRVATWNSENTIGAYSDPARITVIAAPDAPELSVASNSPRPRIEWVAPDQAAYQVLVTDIGGVPEVNYGADNMWQCPYYLSDGDHVVRVRVQNQYGLWSKWAQITVNVVNTPGADITLEVESGNIATLRWKSDGNYDFYLIYRDSKIIDKNYGSGSVEYIDKFAYGTMRYQVRGCYYASSNYGLSNISIANVTPGQYAMLYDAQHNGADYPSVELRHCGLRKQPLQTATSYDIQYFFMHGSQYPHAERSEFVTKKIGGTVIFLPDEETEKDLFMSMAGTLVCLKTQTGEMVIGYLNDVSETALPNPSKSVINFSIQQIDFTEVVDIDA